MFFGDRCAAGLFSDVTAAASLLRKSGFMWNPGELQALDMGGRGKGFRVPVDCKLGGTYVRTHIDVSFGAKPEGATKREFRSMFKGPSFTAWAQPLEAQAADKLAAIITIGMSNTRLKDYRDLLQLSRMDLSTTAVAKALHHTMRERNADMTKLIGPIPDGLSFDFVDEKQWDWRAFAAPQGLTMDFLDVVCDLRHWYADVHERLHALAAADRLEPRSYLQAPSIQPSDSNVYDLEAYRLRMRA